jgi:hypothetical protein
MNWSWSIPVAVIVCCSAGRAEDAPNPVDITFFEENIRPVLAEKCYKCHSQRAQKLKGDLKLDSRPAILKGGSEGPAITVGEPDESLLIKAIRHSVEDFAMPPKEKLSGAVIRDFERWVARGAVFPETAPRREEAAWWDRVDKTKLLTTDKSVEGAVDHYVDAKLAADGVTAVSAADDHEFIRRATLDLAGRIPTLPELETFAASEEKDKRRQLVDRLMASDSFLRQQVIELNWLLMDKQDGKMGEYLTAAIREGRSWDELFKAIILPDQDSETERAAAAFIKERVSDLDRLTVDVSVKFFGVNVSCARCHDHPEVPSWKQDHYYGMKSFFNRTFDNGDYFGERNYGQVSFKTTGGETRQAKPMFLTSGRIDEPETQEPDQKGKEEEKKRLEELKKEKKVPPAPGFSRRAQLVETGLNPGGDGFFSRAVVNQIWHRMFGHGLVMPLDQLHGANSPSHPDLLLWLARDLREHDYDLRRLICGLAVSKTYARASRWGDSQRPVPSYFAVALPRPMTPHQYGNALVIAAQDPAGLKALKPDEQSKRLEQLEERGHDWAKLFERPGELFQIGADEALYLSNNKRVLDDLLGEDGKLVGQLLKIEETGEQIETAWLTVLSREPVEAELREVKSYLDERQDRLPEAWRQVAWSLMTSAEMRFNH